MYMYIFVKFNRINQKIAMINKFIWEIIDNYLSNPNNVQLSSVYENITKPI